MIIVIRLSGLNWSWLTTELQKKLWQYVYNIVIDVNSKWSKKKQKDDMKNWW